MEFKTDLTKSVFKAKYLLPNESSPDEAVSRVVSVVHQYYPDYSKRIEEYIHKRWLLPSGGLWRAARNPDKNVSAINCTTLEPPKDNLESIFDMLYWWAKYAAFGQGEGVDMSLLRPRDAIVHNSSRSSTGPIPFMGLNDTVLQVISQEGRRGASLISLHISHPSIPEFIFIKDEDGVLTNSNISIHITDEFMNLVMQPNALWTFKFKNEYETIEHTMGASEVFDMVCEHAWKSGDPGVLFIDTARKYSNSDVLGYPIVSTNACSEQWLDPNNTCLLASKNLAPYNSDIHEYPYDTETSDMIDESGIIMLDAFRLYEHQEGRSPNPKQMHKLIDMPRIGYGVTGLADYFIAHDIVYGSDKSIIEAGSIFKNIAYNSYYTSDQIARRNGESFPAYDKKKYMKSAFIRRLLDEKVITEDLLDYQAHVCKNTVAPNGTLTEIAEVGGSGIEPIFSKYYVRRERSTKQGEYTEWFTFNHAVKNYLESRGLEVNRGNSNMLLDPKWVTAHTVNNLDKVKLMEEIQKWIDSAISVTYNLPKTATVDDVKQIYYQAWKHGCKGVTVYREGSKRGILITEENYNQNLSDIAGGNRFSSYRPDTVDCDIYERVVNKEHHIILIGLVEGKPYEVFVTNNPDNKIDLQKHKKGYITKIKKGRYDLQVINGTEKTILENISKVFDKKYGTLSRMVSMSLRHEVPIPFIINQLAKDKQFDSFEKAVVRTLKLYIKEGEEVLTSDICPECGSSLIYQGGCMTCSGNKNETGDLCLWSKCD